MFGIEKNMAQMVVFVSNFGTNIFYLKQGTLLKITEVIVMNSIYFDVSTI